MWWECGECGCRVRRQRRPKSCPECGIAGLFIRRPDIVASLEPGGGSIRSYWLECGMNAAQGRSLDGG